MKKTIVKNIFVLAVAVGGAGPAAASEWWYVAHDPNRVLFVDQQSIRREGPVVRYWTLIALHDAAHPAGETKAYMRADCSTQEIGWLATADYDRKDAQGDVSTRPERDAKMARPERETLDQAQLSFVCNAGYRVVNHLFPIKIDEVAFAQAMIRAGPALSDPRTSRFDGEGPCRPDHPVHRAGNGHVRPSADGAAGRAAGAAARLS